MAQEIRSIPIRCSVLCRTTVGRPLRTLSRRAALQLMQAIPASLRPLLTMSEILLSFAYLMAASILVHLRRNRGTQLRIHGRLRRARANEPDCLTCALSAFNRLVVTGRACFVILGFRSCASKLFFEFLQLLVGEIFEIDKLISCAFDCANQSRPISNEPLWRRGFACSESEIPSRT